MGILQCFFCISQRIQWFQKVFRHCSHSQEYEFLWNLQYIAKYQNQVKCIVKKIAGKTFHETRLIGTTYQFHSATKLSALYHISKVTLCHTLAEIYMVLKQSSYCLTFKKYSQVSTVATSYSSYISTLITLSSPSSEIKTLHTLHSN